MVSKIRVVLVTMVVVWLGGCAAKVVPYRFDSPVSVDDPQFHRVVGNLLGPTMVRGNKVETLLNGNQIFPSMLAEIRSAKQTITLETYIYWSGKIGAEFASALTERAQHGVRVLMMVDSIGSSKIDQNYVRQLKAAGAEVFEYHPFHFYDIDSFRQIDHRTHRKLLVVDGTVGFIGGVGIADEWSGNAQDKDHWRDTHYRVQGPVVAQLQSAFMENWMQTTGEVLGGATFFPSLTHAGDLTAQVFKSSYQSGSEDMQLLFLASIVGARKSVHMESAYFVPDTATQHCLIAAAMRGVDVEIIVPGRHIDNLLVRNASRARWGNLLQAGVKISEFQGTMFHCKQMVVDGSWVSIGSANLDDRSFRLNDEANLNVPDAGFGREQEQIFAADLARATPITYAMWKQRGLWQKIVDELLNTAGSEM